MHTRLVVAVTAFLIAGCTSDASSDPTPTQSSVAQPSGSSEQGQRLAATVEQGVSGLRSAHLDIDAGTLGGKVAGDVTLENGETTASDLILDQGSGPVEVITVDGTTYAKLPAGQSSGGKPWIKVSSDSSNEFVRGLAASLELTDAATSIGGLTEVLRTATTSVEDTGGEQVNGASAEHYTLMIDPTKATGDLGTALGTAGTAPIPVDLWLDEKDRPVRVKISIPFGDQSLPLLVDVSKFDAPVTIEAPPPGQTATS